jgi:hypothetical protein
MWWFISACSSAIFLLTIVLSIPIAFDVGGRDAGLAYSLSLFLFYFFYSVAKLLTPDRSRIRALFTNLVGLSQWLVIPTLLIWSLNRFSVDAESTGWVSRTFSQIASTHHATWKEWFFGQEGFIETVALGAWDNTLSYSSPVFQLLEGFCSLLVIQAAGQITRWLVNRGRSDTWVVSTSRLWRSNQLLIVRRSSSSCSPPPSSPAPYTSCGAWFASRRSAMWMRPSSGWP